MAIAPAGPVNVGKWERKRRRRGGGKGWQKEKRERTYRFTSLFKLFHFRRGFNLTLSLSLSYMHALSLLSVV